ncbi:NAD(P)H dehydrogenase (plasmid) [Sinorhizobium americanum CCGM7]|uniref:NAD(P)H oxidoreductase n=1 Tax=Sinorhizobium americanum TaxID=194963 RepID=UPI0004D99133|nr:NAD(P)H oxidoreductase [Sinorhizobium americanum]APG86418.1 NAD(P)H dehydrogenase [Sinorhizobium americanum CCGM7]APG87944.1 NAD(P)H dehydrogenase [Sinorhizobium americanum CCGM7]
MKVLVIYDHPRRSSFCGAVLDAFVSGMHEAGHLTEIADLRAEGFDPRLPPQDEPDWITGAKTCSPEVLSEQERVARNDALAFVFPVWWWSVPATTKGWIDRVWNYGWAYGDRKLTHQKALLLAVCASNAEQYAKRHYDSAMRTQLVQGVIDYCGIREGSLEFLHGALASEDIRQSLLRRAIELGRSF